MTNELPIGVGVGVTQRHLLTVAKLRERVHRMLKCVINLHIEILVFESKVTQLIDDVKDLDDDLSEVRRLDALISTLRDYSGPTICHEWPYPLIFKGTIDDADIAQILNAKMKAKPRPKSTASDQCSISINNNNNNNNNISVSVGSNGSSIHTSGLLDEHNLKRTQSYFPLNS